MLKFLVFTALLLLCSSCSTQVTQSQQPASLPGLASPPEPVPAFIDSFEAENILKPDFRAPQTFSMSFGPQLLELKASYLEKQQGPTGSAANFQQEKVQRYFNVLGSSSLGGSGFIGEGELAYSPLEPPPGQPATLEWPKMLRLSIKRNWNGFNFGADYKSIDQGFVSLTGVRSDRAADEGQFWGQHAFGPFNLRGSVGQSWERLLGSASAQLSKTATASLIFNRSQWAGTLTSSYALIDPASRLDPEAAVITNSLTGLFRPLSEFSLGPILTLKQEWNRGSGARTENPATGLSFAFAPARQPYKLTGVTSFSRSLSTDGSKNLRTVDTNAVFDWKLGKFIGRDDVLSLNVKYNQQLDLTTSTRTRSDVAGMLQFKVTGF